jgi:hypothetical protein
LRKETLLASGRCTGVEDHRAGIEQTEVVSGEDPLLSFNTRKQFSRLTGLPMK